ncbi:hypothetical protein Tco_0830722 [Tanacetum coccineum]
MQGGGCCGGFGYKEMIMGLLEALVIKGGDGGACKLLGRLIGNVIEVLEVLVASGHCYFLERRGERVCHYRTRDIISVELYWQDAKLRFMLFITLPVGAPTGYVFTSSNATISWRLVKQTMSATSANHAKILAIYEASQECVWLRSVIQHIRESCGISSGQDTSNVRSSDNQADLFTKAVPTETFMKLVHGTEMRRLKELK